MCIIYIFRSDRYYRYMAINRVCFLKIYRTLCGGAFSTHTLYNVYIYGLSEQAGWRHSLLNYGKGSKYFTRCKRSLLNIHIGTSLSSKYKGEMPHLLILYVYSIPFYLM